MGPSLAAVSREVVVCVGVDHDPTKRVCKLAAVALLPLNAETCADAVAADPAIDAHLVRHKKRQSRCSVHTKHTLSTFGDSTLPVWPKITESPAVTVQLCTATAGDSVIMLG